MSRSELIIVTVLPEPDSPTIPTVSPPKTSRLTPLTARSVPARVANSTTSSRIEKTGLFSVDSTVSATRAGGFVRKTTPRPAANSTEPARVGVVAA